MNKKDVVRIFNKYMKKYADKDGSLFNEKFSQAVGEYERELNKQGGKIIDCGRLHDLDVLETFRPIFSSIGYNLMHDPFNFGDENTLVLAPQKSQEKRELDLLYKLAKKYDRAIIDISDVQR